MKLLGAAAGPLPRTPSGQECLMGLKLGSRNWVVEEGTAGWPAGALGCVWGLGSRPSPTATGVGGSLFLACQRAEDVESAVRENQPFPGQSVAACFMRGTEAVT